jgi:5-methylcytosine-specific restriction enzyme B
MHIDPELVKKAILKLSTIEYTAGRRDGNKDCISMLLLVLRAGASTFTWQEKEQLFESSDDYLLGIYELGGLFDENEEPGKRACLFFNSFYQANDIQASHFYNQATAFSGLFSRLKDTIDNSIADYIFDKGLNDSYRLKRDYISNVTQMYSEKFSLDALVIWCNRHRDIGDNTLSDLRKDFLDRYRISLDTARELFDTSNFSKLTFNDEPITGREIRDLLNATEHSEISSNPTPEQIRFNHPLEFSDKYIGRDYMMTPEKLHDVLLRNKQIILTGVPGTGKSHMLEPLAQNFSNVRKIQFHQNYTYQDFIYGKSLQDGNVVGEKGALLDFIDECANADSNCLLILDEINRGNVSSIFGEFLYALDRDKPISIHADNEEISLELPDNLFVVGTMNTADRSIALVDFAIRRRFMFIELEPDYSVIDQNSTYKDQEILGNFLKEINKRIIDQFDNTEYQLGHSFFIRSDKKDWSDEDLFETLHFKIFPMIVEYAHGDTKSLVMLFGESLVSASQDNLYDEVQRFIE